MSHTECYTLSLHDALPISKARWVTFILRTSRSPMTPSGSGRSTSCYSRSEEHTSELQSLRHLVCRLLLEKKIARCYRSTVARQASLTLYTSHTLLTYLVFI